MTIAENRFFNRMGQVICRTVPAMILLWFLPFVSLAQNEDTLITTDHLSIIFAGDIMGHDGQINGAWDPVKKKYDYEPTFRYIRDYLSSADVAVANLEVTLGGTPYKGYPAFSSPDELALELRDAGFDVLITANNHALDRGEKGFLRTLDVLDTLPVLRAGTYRDQAERNRLHPLVFEKNNLRLALLNYTYGTNGLTIPEPGQINRIDTTMIRIELQKALEADPDYVIVCIHWGLEYQREENAEQRRLAEFMFCHGADAIIGSHPHVVQPIRFYGSDRKDSLIQPVVFSLGNFVSNQREQYKDGGVVAELHLSKRTTLCSTEKGGEAVASVKLDSLSYLPYWVWREENQQLGRQVFYVVPVSRYEEFAGEINLKASDSDKLTRFARDTRSHLEGIPESDFYRLKARELKLKVEPIIAPVEGELPNEDDEQILDREILERGFTIIQ
ncbi:MAG: CapA family protein [Bacteroidales bacterium]|nr:CapA family protein [Bacteroidales bacterium]